MEQERIFYHGSIIGGLDTILANSKSHTDGNRVAYFTEDRVYALVCCRSREENLVTMGPRDGVQHYFERFPDQLRVIYGGKEGFIYRPVSSGTLEHTRDHTWESHEDVSVVLYEHITDVYEEILREEKAGNVIIHRYEEIDPEEQKKRASDMREYIKNNPQLTYRDFVIEHFSPLWE